MNDDSRDPVDPEPGTRAFYELPVSEQERICFERAGIRPGKNSGGAFMSPGANYSDQDPVGDPISKW